jgi:RNA polymerase sigma factor (sigma-70 family)
MGKVADVELMRRWERARRMAARSCARTFGQLRAGAGGFYDADDFAQDLFLAFWRIERRWREEGSGDEAALWRAWRRFLCHGGSNVLRRRPQRLWSGSREEAVAPELFELGGGEAAGAPGPAGLARRLSRSEDAAAVYARRSAWARLAGALWALPARQRQVLYMVVVQERPATAVAELLDLETRDVRRVLARGLRALRDLLAAEEDAPARAGKEGAG